MWKSAVYYPYWKAGSAWSTKFPTLYDRFYDISEIRQFTETSDDSYEDMPDTPVIIRDGYGEKETVDSTSFTVALVVSGVLLLAILITGRKSVTSYSNWVAVPNKEKVTEDVS